LPRGGDLPPTRCAPPPGHRLKELERFFLDYKVLENKKVIVEDFRGRVDAENAIRDAERLYRERIKVEQR
jgi:inorganic pyrophosphatase